jgi:hypothetical protein
MVKKLMLALRGTENALSAMVSVVLMPLLSKHVKDAEVRE